MGMIVVLHATGGVRACVVDVFGSFLFYVWYSGSRVNASVNLFSFCKGVISSGVTMIFVFRLFGVKGAFVQVGGVRVSVFVCGSWFIYDFVMSSRFSKYVV